MGRIDETHFHEYPWHHGVLEYVEVASAVGVTPLGELAAEKLAEFFRKGFPLSATLTIPDFLATGVARPRTVRVWIGIEMYGNKYSAMCFIRNATPFPEGHENIVVSGEYRNGALVVEDFLKLTYNSERKIFLVEDAT